MAPGEDIMTADLVKGGGRMLCPCSLLMERQWEEEQVPEESNNAITYPKVARRSVMTTEDFTLGCNS
jgi:hypothetical protein